MIVSVNGHITDAQQAHISATSEAFLRGLGVFETLRTYHKQPFKLREHLGRLYVSADIMGIKSKWKAEDAYKEVMRVVERMPFKEGRIRIVLTPGDLIVYVEALKEKPKAYYDKGVELLSYVGQRHFPRAKKLADHLCYEANDYARKRGAYEAVLKDVKGYVHECAYANIFWVENGHLITTNKDILFGITREFVIEIAGGAHFEALKYRSLLKADEVFITQTSSGILPVVKIDGKKIGSGRPGPVTKKLMKRFKSHTWEQSSQVG
jgi:branched-chain amino acid aminotransferase